MKAFSEQLIQARKARGLTQTQLANVMGLTRQGISNWERGRSVPDQDSILQLSKLLDWKFDIPGISIQEGSAENPLPMPMPQQPSRKKTLLLCAASFILGLAVMFVFTNIIPSIKPAGSRNYGSVPSDIIPDTEGWFRYEREYNPEHANINIGYSANPVKAVADPGYPDGYGWFYTFYYTEMNGIDFHPESYTEYFIGSDGRTNTISYTAEDMTSWWGENTIPGHDQRYVRGGLPLQDVAGIGLKIAGTDAKGEALEFFGYLELSQEIEETPAD